MKVKFILAVYLLIVSVQTMFAQTLKLYLSDKHVVEYSVENVDSLVFTDGAGDTAETHEWVDLGLPSGTLWATCNVGANSPEEYGDYFAWGEIEPKNDYSWSTYKYCKGSYDTMTKYCTVDNKTELEPSDDAATAIWGSDWQMPSKEQFEELLNSSYTTTTWTALNGVYGYEITSKSNGDSIFCRLLVGATVRASAMQVATATIGRVRSVRSAATALATWTSVPAVSARATGTTAAAAGAFAPSV